jgi:organic hydroperoxide reductase OsmC/OhrA
MLFFLALAAKQGFAIMTYEENAIGVMSKTSDGRESMTKVTLRPRVAFAGDKRPIAEEVDALHHQAHEACYIANSVKTEVLIEGQAEGLG